MHYFELNFPTLENIEPVAADAQKWVHAAVGYFLVEGDTVEMDMCHFELMLAVLG